MVKACIMIDINLPCFMTTQKAKEIKESYASLIPALKKERIGIYYLLSNFEKSTDLMRKTQLPSEIPATIISSDIPPYKGLDSISWKACQKSS
jgi:hypothetical protein